jgi:hypothetical protein
MLAGHQDSDRQGGAASGRGKKNAVFKMRRAPVHGAFAHVYDAKRLQEALTAVGGKSKGSHCHARDLLIGDGPAQTVPRVPRPR